MPLTTKKCVFHQESNINQSGSLKANMIAYIGLGSNLNQPKEQIKQALMSLEVCPEININHLSKLYQSKPLLDMPQPDYYNAVVQITTTLRPLGLLEICQKIEQKQHRIRERKWGARTIDLDLLLCDEQTIDTKILTIPHSQIANRVFVLLPLLDIKPDLTIPKLGLASELLTRLDLSKIKIC